MQYRNKPRTEKTQGAKGLIKGRSNLQQKIGEDRAEGSHETI